MSGDDGNSFITDNHFVNEFLFAAPMLATCTQRSFPGDKFLLIYSMSDMILYTAAFPQINHLAEQQKQEEKRRNV
jgi:hypothetical protein